MKRLIAIIIFISLVYFLVGALLVYFHLFTGENYLLYGSIVGSLASVAGLLSFLKPSISNDDIKKIELDSIQSIKLQLQKLEDLENESSQTKQKIGQLEIQKQEMELLVKKASLALFLKEQYINHEKEIIRAIKVNSKLKDDLAELENISQQLATLEVEIDSDPNVSLLKEIALIP